MLGLGLRLVSIASCKANTLLNLSHLAIVYSACTFPSPRSDPSYYQVYVAYASWSCLVIAGLGCCFKFSWQVSGGVMVGQLVPS